MTSGVARHPFIDHSVIRRKCVDPFPTEHGLVSARHPAVEDGHLLQEAETPDRLRQSVDVPARPPLHLLSGAAILSRISLRPPSLIHLPFKRSGSPHAMKMTVSDTAATFWFNPRQIPILPRAPLQRNNPHPDLVRHDHEVAWRRFQAIQKLLDTPKPILLVLEVVEEIAEPDRETIDDRDIRSSGQRGYGSGQVGGLFQSREPSPRSRRWAAILASISESRGSAVAIKAFRS